MDFKANQGKLFLVAILFLAFFLRFWHLSNSDINSDDALYSFRALGWFDYLGGGQTTPVNWFNSVPWWGQLSFHDAPPAVFAVQNIFFKIFGPNFFAAKLPFALAGLGVVILVYFIVRLFRPRETALLAAALMAVSSFAVWASRIGYLEGMEVFFIALSFLFFARYLARGKSYDLIWWGAAVGLSLLSKYTALFLLPAAVVYFLFWPKTVKSSPAKNIFQKYEFWLAWLVLVVVITPIIIYNFQVFQTRGHFDAALSSMVGMHPEDFKSISSRGLNINLAKNFAFLGNALYQSVSWPMFLLFISSLVYFLIKIFRKKNGPLENFLVINVLFLILMFLFTGAGARFFSIVMPLAAILGAIAVNDLWQWLSIKDFAVIKKILLIILVLAFSWEFFYTVNTNLSARSWGQPTLFYSANRFYDLGFNRLEKYLQDKVFGVLPRLKTPHTMADFVLKPEDVRGRDFVLTDERIDWFAYTWYLEKYPLFYRLPVISFSSLLSGLPAGNSDPLAFLKGLGVKSVYYIFAADDAVLDSVKKDNSDFNFNMKLLAGELEKRGVAPVEIKNGQGITAFKIYHLNF